MKESKSSETQNVDEISSFPEIPELLQRIFFFVNPEDTAAVMLTCRRFHAVINSSLPDSYKILNSLLKLAIAEADTVPNSLQVERGCSLL